MNTRTAQPAGPFKVIYWLAPKGEVQTTAHADPVAALVEAVERLQGGYQCRLSDAAVTYFRANHIGANPLVLSNMNGERRRVPEVPASVAAAGVELPRPPSQPKRRARAAAPAPAKFTAPVGAR